MYSDPDTGSLKGDGTVTYLLRPALENAINILDGAHLRPGCIIRVEEANFSGKKRKSNSNNSAQADAKGISGAKRRRPASTTATATERQRQVPKLKEAQILSWEEGESEHSGLKIVVLKNAFDPAVDFVWKRPWSKHSNGNWSTPSRANVRDAVS